MFSFPHTKTIYTSRSPLSGSNEESMDKEIPLMMTKYVEMDLKKE